MQCTEVLLAEHSSAAFISQFDQGQEKKVLCTQSPLQDQSISTQGYRLAEKNTYLGLYSTSQLRSVCGAKDNELLCCPKGTEGSFL